MIDYGRLVQIVENSKLKKSASYPTCCPWCLATHDEIAGMAQELIELRRRVAQETLGQTEKEIAQEFEPEINWGV
ncbi:MAG: hypothetical protein KGL39_41090 [Patescibacteria group bacterium]|nr:hypothetical protein [Patescibacteria group bacterium]